MAIAINAPVQEQKADFFKENTKLSVNGWFLLFVFAFLTGMAGFITVFPEDWVVRLIGFFAAIFATSVLTSLFWGAGLTYREKASSQCFQLAEEIGLSLTRKQIVELERCLAAGGVFVKFVGLIPSECLPQPKEHYFVVGGVGKSDDCRKFVRFLHENPKVFRPEQVGYHAEPDERPIEESET